MRQVPVNSACRSKNEVAEHLAAHPDGTLIRSLPAVGVVSPAKVIACTGDIARFDSPDALAAAAGLAPVLRQSGNHT